MFQCLPDTILQNFPRRKFDTTTPPLPTIILPSIDSLAQWRSLVKRDTDSSAHLPRSLPDSVLSHSGFLSGPQFKQIGRTISYFWGRAKRLSVKREQQNQGKWWKACRVWTEGKWISPFAWLLCRTQSSGKIQNIYFHHLTGFCIGWRQMGKLHFFCTVCLMGPLAAMWICVGWIIKEVLQQSEQTLFRVSMIQELIFEELTH